MLDRKLAAGELRPERPADLADLGVLAAAIEHVERTARAGAEAPPARRGQWRRAARREGLR